MRYVRDIAAGLVLLGMLACGSEDQGQAGGAPASAPETAPALDMSALIETPTGLRYEDLEMGQGAAAKPGETVEVHYTGWFLGGDKFDSSLDRGQPFTFLLGSGQVIPGWDQGVVGMKVGGKRRLVIPPDLAYGAAGRAGIPPNSTLVFDVELLGVGG